MEQESLNKEQRTKKHKYFLVSAVAFLVLLCSLSIWTVLKYNRVSNQYGLDSFQYKKSQRSVIYSADGVVLTYLYHQNRDYVSIDQISQPMQQAIIAIEDHRFHEHFGIDVIGTTRALYIDLISGEALEGGSTITQQLVRNLFLSSEKTLSRKITEMFLAIKMEDRFTKEEILEMYLNEIYFGNGCYGIETAALKYFGKHASELSLLEATMLAGIPQAPSKLDPIYHAPENRARQKDTLKRMVELSYITKEEAHNILQKEISIKKPDRNETSTDYKFPYFTTEVIRQLVDRYGKEKVYNGGLKIVTTLDSRAAAIAEELARKKIKQFKESGISAYNISIVSINNQDGAVISLVGGSDFNRDQNNLAIIPRQPGSAIKPLHYAGALDKGIINENALLNASSRSFGKYYVSSNVKANVSVCVALKNSMNVPSVEVVNALGIQKTIENLKRFGITTISQNDYNLAIALGGMYNGIKPLELAAAYTTFAHAGIYNKPYMIKTVEEENGSILYRHQPENKQIISPRTAQLITQMLVEVVRGGTGTRANISGNEAGKTGTTNDSRCLWFVGFNQDVSTAVWIGNSNNQPVYGFHGGDLAAPIWREYTATLIQKQIIHKSVRIYQTVLPIKQVYVEQNIEKDEPMEGEKGNKAEDNQTNAGNDTQTDENSQNTPPNNNENTTPVQPENQAPLPVSSPTETPAVLDQATSNTGLGTT
ncbi:penicillin-binding protein, 1A family [Desulforamulus reducens MI-1]|uniref:Penicillin-binding protein 1A n=1 Tax=Desulforamulus reducens (strain ATCC BAA-1160 / DSM 100696 / MI-1) TaxID=349161 RepID=A4J5H5_DESRM|nr:PBP1A family penicillin-binding protein [Desulforamulus reducens]ABO50328.1 penicillin-binding protein, 1A family [Desulforamulus reducens MI-1]